MGRSSTGHSAEPHRTQRGAPKTGRSDAAEADALDGVVGTLVQHQVRPAPGGGDVLDEIAFDVQVNVWQRTPRTMWNTLASSLCFATKAGA